MMLVIYGPTSTGKTALSIRLAKTLNGEIISADSRQVYKGLDIGSGKVSFDMEVSKKDGYWEVEGVNIYGFDIKNPQDDFSVADFISYAKQSIKEIKSKNKLPIIAGGTGFYLTTLIYGLDTLGIPKNKSLREELEKLNAEELLKVLQRINPVKAKSLNESDIKNPRRLIRAIEISKAKPTQAVKTDEESKILTIGLTAPNDYIYKKVDEWLKTRFKNGLIEEVESLRKKGISKKWLEGLGLEYRWVSKYLNGEMSQEEAQEKLKGEIHSLVRRQKNWFSKFKNIFLFDISKRGWEIELNNLIKSWYTAR